MTITRYNELKKQWLLTPPTHVMVMRIAQMFGYEPPRVDFPTSTMPEASNDVYYDESYYPNTPQTPHRANAYNALAADFAAAGGVVK